VILRGHCRLCLENDRRPLPGKISTSSVLRHNQARLTCTVCAGGVVRCSLCKGQIAVSRWSCISVEKHWWDRSWGFLTERSNPLAISVAYPERLYSVAVSPKTKADSLNGANTRLAEEDPKLAIQPGTSETILGNG
jgi:hypothetical protein